MNRFPPIALVAATVAASVISACSERTPVAPNGARIDNGSPRASRDLDVESFIPIDVSGATATVAFAINDAGAAVGRYVSDGRTHGFMRSPAGDFTTIDFPGAGFTVAGAINDAGDIVGWYTLPASPSVRHGYLLRNGEFTTIDPPGSIFTNVLGINNSGDVVGRYCFGPLCREPGRGDFHAFLYRDGEFTNLDVPSSNETNAWKVNNRGEIVGSFSVAGGPVELFLKRDGELTTFVLPNGKPLSADNGAINAQGDIVGKYCDVSPCLIGPTGHGFLLRGEQLITIDIPGARGSSAFGVNARGDVVGGYFDAAGALHGYLLDR